MWYLIVSIPDLCTLTYFGIWFVFANVKAWIITSCSGSIHGQQKARKMYRKDENLYVMFVDLKNYVNGMLMHCQQ